jgi:polysaccharide pyruvyl transferase CsaB
MRAVLCGYYGMGNGGDEALLASLLQMLPASVTPLVLSGNPAETQDRYGVQAIHRKRAGALLRALGQADALIWGGGSLLQDATSRQNPLYYGGLMILAQWLGLKTIAWGQGIGPLNHGLSRALGRYALGHCDAISVRDGGSLAWLERWRLTGCQAPDPVWALTALPAPDLVNLPGPRVAVALRPHPWLTADRLEQFTQALVNFQAATQTAIVLVPFQPSKDLAIATFIQPRLPGPSQICALADPRQLKGLFRQVELTLGMRLHALIMAAAEGNRCFALSYDPKVSHLMQELNLPGFDLNPQATDGWPGSVDAITQAWLEVYEHGQPLSRDRRDQLFTQALTHQTLLERVLT